MRRCGHPHLIVREHLDAWSIWEFRDGALVDEGTCAADLTGLVEVECPDCGYVRRIGLKGQRPAWLKPYMEQITHYGWREEAAP